MENQNINLNDFSMTFNEEIAKGAEPSRSYVKESGVYEGEIVKVLLEQSKAAGSKSWGLSFFFKTDDGEEANYMSLNCTSREGSFTYPDKKTGVQKPMMGFSMVNSIMGLLGIMNLVAQKGKDSVGYAAFCGKKITLALQKVLYTKSDGTEGYKFDIIRAFEYRTRKTLSEKKAGKEGVICNMEIKDKDERNPRTGNNSYSLPQQGSYSQQSQTTASQDQTTQYDDILPF